MNSANMLMVYKIPQVVTIDNVADYISKYEMTQENFCLSYNNNNKSREPSRETSKETSASSTPPIQISAPPALANTDYIPVDTPNSLFWCLYISKIGLSEYELLNQNKYKNVEMEQKQNAIKFLGASAKWTKCINQKITNIKFKEMLSDLFTNQEIDVFTVFLLSLYYDLHIYLINRDDTVYTEYIPNTEKYSSGGLYENTIIVKMQKSGKYSVDVSPSVEKLDKIKSLYRIDHICKPVTGISTFKTPELTDILKKLGVSLTGNKSAMFVEYKHYIETKTFFNVSPNRPTK
jgi:hypothetical protein